MPLHLPPTARRPVVRGASARTLRFESLEPRCLLAAHAACDLVKAPTIAVDTSQFDASRIIVTLRDSQAGPDALAGTTTADGRAIGTAAELMAGIYAIDLAPGVAVTDAIAAYEARSDVLAAEPDFAVQIDVLPNDSALGQLWGLNNTGQNGGRADADIDAAEAWNVTTGSGNFVIAVIDTGVDYSHPDLVNNIWVNPGEIAGNGRDDDGNGYVDDVRGWDFANNDNNPMDDNGHGTHVAGTIAAQGGNGIGVAGVNWNAKILPIKFLTSSGGGVLSAAVKAIDYAVSVGAKLSNNSWSTTSSSSTLAAAISRAQAAGHIFVAAAGNSGQNSDSRPQYPAAFNYDNVVSVAASDRTDVLASFSNYGVTSVDLAAPGANIYSTLRGGSYGTMSGTSMAAPHVTGAVALLWDKFPQLDYRQVINLILGNVDKLSTLTGKVASGGRLNVHKALVAAGAVAVPPDNSNPPVDDAPSPAPIEQAITASNGADVRINDLRLANSYITINSHLTITDVDVWIDVRHRTDNHLRITLYGPGDAASANLMHRLGGNGDNYRVTTFDDEASRSITTGAAPFSGTFRPTEQLAAFDGKDANGRWRLAVYDYVRGTTGTIAGWGLTIRGVSASGQSFSYRVPANTVATELNIAQQNPEPRSARRSFVDNRVVRAVVACAPKMQPPQTVAIDHVLAGQPTPTSRCKAHVPQPALYASLADTCLAGA